MRMPMHTHVQMLRGDYYQLLLPKCAYLITYTYIYTYIYRCTCMRTYAVASASTTIHLFVRVHALMRIQSIALSYA